MKYYQSILLVAAAVNSWACSDGNTITSKSDAQAIHQSASNVGGRSHVNCTDGGSLDESETKEGTSVSRKTEYTHCGEYGLFLDGTITMDGTDTRSGGSGQASVHFSGSLEVSGEIIGTCVYDFTLTLTGKGDQSTTGTVCGVDSQEVLGY